MSVGVRLLYAVLYSWPNLLHQFCTGVIFVGAFDDDSGLAGSLRYLYEFPVGN